MSKIFKTEALVIKRINYKDSDKVVTLFTKEYGKISALAKGIRKITSKRRASLEPINRVKMSLVETSHLPVIAETTLIESFPSIKLNLPRLTQAMQVMEIVDKLTAENQPHESIYEELITTLTLINTNKWTRRHSVDSIKYVLSELGFGYLEDSEMQIKDHIEEIAQRRLVTKKYFFES